MSSWKQYGGKNTSQIGGRINTESLTVNTLVMKEAYYPGDLSMNGNLKVKNVDIRQTLSVRGNTNIVGDTNISGNMIIGTSVRNLITINGEVAYKGNITYTGAQIFDTDLESKQNVISNGNIFVKGSVIYFGPTNSQTIINNSTGMGINTLTPGAGLHLVTNNSTGLKIKSSASSSESILVENSSERAIKVFANTTSSGLTMFNTTTNNVEANISTTDRSLLIDTSFVNVLNKMTISTNPSMFNTNRYEPLTVFGVQNTTPFYQTIYKNTSVYDNPTLAIKSINNSSIASVRIDSSNNKLSLYAGRYAGDNTGRTMGMFQLDDKNPSITMVSGSSTQKYFSTTGINTYKPMTDSYVLNVNGPVNINNNDISSLYTTDFEICDICESKINKGFLAAIGNKWDLSGNVYVLKNKFLHSFNYGNTWSVQDITSTVRPNQTDSVKITSVHTYDTENIFITGEKNTLVYGNTVSLNLISSITLGGENTYNHIFINPFQKANNSLRGYFSIDLSYSFVIFDMSKNNRLNLSYRKLSLDASDNKITRINSIQAYSNSIYIGGTDNIKTDPVTHDPGETYSIVRSDAVIIKYSHSIDSDIQDTLPVFEKRQVFSTQAFKYTIEDIQVFDNSFVIGVGNSCVLFTKDGGINWTSEDKAWNEENPVPAPVALDISLNSCYIIDYSNVIIVGTNASSYQVDNRSNNIFINSARFVNNLSGQNWIKMPDYLIESSGKRELLISNTTFKKVIIPDINNIIILNTSSPFSSSPNSGSSILYNIFTPNYRNAKGNPVLDIYGTVSITSDNLVGGDLIAGNMVSADTMRITSTKASTSTITGALVVNGGVGIQGNIYVDHLSQSSDYRIKSGVKSLHELSYNVCELNPVYYFNEKTRREDIGFIAHEIQMIYPFLVTGEKDGESLQSINYSGLIAVLVKEIQELKEENIKFNRRLSQLEL